MIGLLYRTGRAAPRSRLTKPALRPAPGGPHATLEVLPPVNSHLPQPHDPYLDLLPPQGVRLTPRHYGYLKISEGCNNKCSFCIIPSLRGLLASRPLDEVMREAEILVAGG